MYLYCWFDQVKKLKKKILKIDHNSMRWYTLIDLYYYKQLINYYWRQHQQQQLLLQSWWQHWWVFLLAVICWKCVFRIPPSHLYVFVHVFEIYFYLFLNDKGSDSDSGLSVSKRKIMRNISCCVMEIFLDEHELNMID